MASAQIIPPEVLVLNRVARHERQVAFDIRLLGRQLHETKALLGDAAAHLTRQMSAFEHLQAQSREAVAFCRSCSAIIESGVPLEAMLRARDELLRRHEGISSRSYPATSATTFAKLPLGHNL